MLQLKKIFVKKMIFGIGTDILDSRRFDEKYQKLGKKFLDRLFTETEQKKCDKRKNRILSYSKIFCAKEATIKAIGRFFSWHDIELISNNYGKPSIIIKNDSLMHLNKVLNDAYNIYVSLTDEPPYAQAFVIIEGK